MAKEKKKEKAIEPEEEEMYHEPHYHTGPITISNITGNVTLNIKISRKPPGSDPPPGGG